MTNYLIYFFEILIVLILTYLFINFQKPKLRFLFLGYFFMLITIVFQIPMKYLKYKIMELFPTQFQIPLLIIVLVNIIILELIKYFSLKKFLKTKSFKNAILFGIGWVSIQSINIFTILIYTYIFTIIPNNFNFNFLITNNSLNIINFILFFVINLSITVLVIFSIIKRKKQYLIFGIIYNILIYVIFEFIPFPEKNIFKFLIFIYSLYIIFRYKKLK